jgi:hypothetical protein
VPNETANGSFGLIDASQYVGPGDICGAINTILTNYLTTEYGIVVDARGVNPGIAQPCSTNPWAGVNDPHFTSVVLLPPGTIKIGATWLLPQHTRVVGQGPGATVLQAAPGFSGTYMIDMGSPTLCSVDLATGFPDCPSVQVEHLTIDGNSGNGLSVGGIRNRSSQEKSYVNDVTFTNIANGNIALDIESTSSFNSGPYTNLTMSNVGTCLNIGNHALPTRGVHGLTCSTTPTSTVAIYLDGINNSLEDIYILGGGGSSQDGILVGSQAPAGNNLLFNISGSGLNNVVHICGTNQMGHCPGNASVSDITMLGVTRMSTGNTIKDDLTSTTLADATVGMYVVGEPVQGNTPGTIGYSRFTTSSNTNAPTWLVGAARPSSPCATGSLFSQTASSATTTLWGCGGGNWYAIH